MAQKIQLVMTTWKLEGNDLIFTIQGSSPYDEDCRAILSNITDNGIGETEGDTITIPKEAIFLLSEGQSRILELPKIFEGYLYIDSEGMVNRPGFKYIPSFLPQKSSYQKYSVSHANYPFVTLTHPEGEKEDYILPEAMSNTACLVSIANKKGFEKASKSYYTLASMKQGAASSDGHVFFNDYLENYDIHIIDTVKTHIDSHDGHLEITPEISDEQRKEEGIPTGELANRFDQRSRVLDIYTLQGEKGREHKIVMPEGAREQLDNIKNGLRDVSDPAVIQDIIANPQNYFDEDLIDLREFYSDRVIRIGLYKPQFYGFVCPYKSEWVPGFVIQDPYNGNTNVLLKENAAIEAFEGAIKAAAAIQAPYVEYCGYSLEYSQAKHILEIAKAQNRNPKKKLENINGKQVLIIEDNAESLGYRVQEVDNNTPDLYQFHEIEGLKNDFSLKEHQVAGVAWLQHLVMSHNKGCLLADDMGLGKTLQLLCFIDWHKRHFNPDCKPYLIVAPVSLLDNWQKEITKFMKPGALYCTIVHGNKIGKKRNNDDIDWLRSQNIILTNYETVRSGQFNICAVDYAAVVLDEAQKIKTPGTYVTTAAKALKADFKVAMTGTPVENTFVDLWCIMDFAIPGLLGNAREFSKQYQYPLRTPDIDIEALGRKLREHLGVFFLRRQKLDVLKDLPDKTEFKTEIVMSSLQVDRYINEVKHAKEIIKMGDPAGMLRLLHRLRRLSDSPYILDENIDMESIPVSDLITASAKISVTMDILNEIKCKGEKAIIFCIFKESQRMLQRIIASVYGITPKIINGDTKVLSTGYTRNFESNYSRQQAIDDFESHYGFNVIIMSPIAAGMGLNVTAANHVIHFGRHWNPAKESQATDRAYRIGQDKPVSVYYPLTVLPESYNFKSFDQTLDTLLMRKTALAEATLFPTEATEVRPSDFIEMFNQGDGIPEDI